ncbi:membrane protein [Mycobacterium phage Indlovu]|nr:membrane protein [Mycobacterium phage Indlovu]
MDNGYAVLVLIVWVLAVMRLTRLINGDKITDRLRLWPANKIRTGQLARAEALGHGQLNRAAEAEEHIQRWDKVLYFIECPWCVSMWVAFGSAWVPLFYSENVVARYFGVALAASHLVGVLARFADTEEIDIEDDDDQ